MRLEVQVALVVLACPLLLMVHRLPAAAVVVVVLAQLVVLVDLAVEAQVQVLPQGHQEA